MRFWPVACTLLFVCGMMFAGFITDTHVFIVGLYEWLGKTCIFPMSFGLSGVPLPELGLRNSSPIHRCLPWLTVPFQVDVRVNNLFCCAPVFDLMGDSASMTLSAFRRVPLPSMGLWKTSPMAVTICLFVLFLVLILCKKGLRLCCSCFLGTS